MASSNPCHEPQPLDKKPRKSILKQPKSPSYDQSIDEPDAPTPTEQQKKEATFDEMNILETYHPPDKTYGHMKIDEPNTPYHYMKEGAEGSQPVSDAEDGGMNPSSLMERLAEDRSPPRAMRRPSLPSDDDEEEGAEVSEEEKERKQVFEERRKKHYNEFFAVKLARQMMDTEEEGGEEDGPRDQ